MLPGNLLDSRHVGRVAGDDDAAGIFAKQHELGRQALRRQLHARADSLRKRLFRQRHRQPAVGAVMHRLRQAMAHHFDHGLLQRRFFFQIKLRWISPQLPKNFLGVLRRPELALHIRDIGCFSGAQ